MSTTTVNAGFSRRSSQYRHGREWMNVQRILVPLPAAQLGSKAFRDLVRLQHPPGEGWQLEGYALADEGAGSARRAATDDDAPKLVELPALDEAPRLGLNGLSLSPEAAQGVALVGAEVVDQRLQADAALHALAAGRLRAEGDDVAGELEVLVGVKGDGHGGVAQGLVVDPAHSIHPTPATPNVLSLDMDQVVRHALRGKKPADPEPGKPRAGARAALQDPQTMSTEPSIEAEIQARASVAPRVTPADLEAEIASEHYFTAGDGYNGAGWIELMDDRSGVIEGLKLAPPPAELHLVTICVVLLKNGHRSIGVNEGPVSVENFDAELGCKMARQKALNQLWPLLGFRLRDKLASAVPA